MGSIFEGTPQTATSYSSTSTETPKWMQDAIYNQIQWAQNVANTPYQSYDMPTVASMSPLQQQAYSNIVANQGAWAPALQSAQQGLSGLSTAGTAGDLSSSQGRYLRSDLMSSNLSKGQDYWNRAGKMDIVGAAQPALAEASLQNAMTAASPFLWGAASQDIVGSADPYLNRAASMSPTQAGSYGINSALNTNIVGAAQPYMTQAGDATGQAMNGRALDAANPYLQASAQNATANISDYMNPYQQNVMDVIAKQGARNLSQNILPGISDSFIKAGSFGSSRMGDMGSRAIRDTQEAVLDQQAKLANQGYEQAINASQQDLARQAQIGSIAGNLSSTDLARILQAGAQYGNLGQTAGQLAGQQGQLRLAAGQAAGQLTAQEQAALTNIGQTRGQLTGQQASVLNNIGQTAGQLTSQQMQNLISLAQAQGGLTKDQMAMLTNLGQSQTAAGVEQQRLGLNAAQATANAQAQDYANQIGALSAMAANSQREQQMRTADAAALEAAGRGQQQQLQSELNAAYGQWQNEQLYPRQQLDWLSTQLRGMAPITPQVTNTYGSNTGGSYSPSPLSQLASGLYTYQGLTSP